MSIYGEKVRAHALKRRAAKRPPPEYVAFCPGCDTKITGSRTGYETVRSATGETWTIAACIVEPCGCMVSAEDTVTFTDISAVAVAEATAGLAAVARRNRGR